MSIIAQYYSVYFTKFEGIPINTLKMDNLSLAQKSLIDNLISRIIKSYYSGYKPFPMEYFNEKVANVYSSKRPLEFATYYECLITDSPF